MTFICLDFLKPYFAETLYFIMDLKVVPNMMDHFADFLNDIKEELTAGQTAYFESEGPEKNHWYLQFHRYCRNDFKTSPNTRYRVSVKCIHTVPCTMD